MAASCLDCPHHQEPFKHTDFPSQPWKDLVLGLMGPYLLENMYASP